MDAAFGGYRSPNIDNVTQINAKRTPVVVPCNEQRWEAACPPSVVRELLPAWRSLSDLVRLDFWMMIDKVSLLKSGAVDDHPRSTPQALSRPAGSKNVDLLADFLSRTASN